jgi:hypothetical protein
MYATSGMKEHITLFHGTKLLDSEISVLGVTSVRAISKFIDAIKNTFIFYFSLLPFEKLGCARLHQSE